jgi:hypothetical protein
LGLINCISLNLLLSQAYAVNCWLGFFKVVVKNEMAGELELDRIEVAERGDLAARLRRSVRMSS